MKNRFRTLIVLLVIAVIAASLPTLIRVFVYPLRYKELIAKEARRNSVDPYLLAAIILHESRFDPESVSDAGAVGLMQIMPETGRWLKGDRNVDVAELKKPEVSIALGARYVRYLKRKYGDERLALAAYNGGSANLDSWLKRERDGDVSRVVDRIPFDETRNFVLLVMESKRRYRLIYPGAFD